MARSAEVDLRFIGNAGSAIAALRGVGNAADSTGSKFRKRLLVGVKAGAAGAALAIGAFAVKSVKAASDLQEEISKVNTVFGISGPVIQSWSKTTADSLGISRREALGAAGTFGGLFTTMKFTQPEAAKMSMRMVQLAGDMASFNNASPEETLTALRAGLIGESEPLRRFNVLLTAAKVKQEALNLGLSDGTKELTEAQKAQARYSIILRESAVQHGDVARTQGDLAGQTRKLQAKFEDLQAMVGRFLIPVTLKLVSALVKVIETGVKIADWDGWPRVGQIISVPFKIAKKEIEIMIGIVRGTISAGQAVVGWGGWRVIGAIISAPFNAAKSAVNGLIMLIGSIIRVVQSAANAISGLTGKASSVVGKVKSVVGSVTGFLGFGAEGAIVNRPTLSLIGEAGPEAVVPLNRMPGARRLPNGMGGGGSIFNITVHALEPRSAADAVVEAIRQFERRNGAQFARA